MGALLVVLVAGAQRLAGRRDVGAGLLPPRRGPAGACALLSGPTGLLTRVQGGTVAGWAMAMLLPGLTFGSLTDSVSGRLAATPGWPAPSPRTGASPADSFTAATALYYGLCAAACTVGSELRLRGEDISGRLELLLSAGPDRRRLLAAGLSVAATAAAVLLTAAGVGSGIGAAAVSGDTGMVARHGPPPCRPSTSPSSARRADPARGRARRSGGARVPASGRLGLTPSGCARCPSPRRASARAASGAPGRPLPGAPQRNHSVDRPDRGRWCHGGTAGASPARRGVVACTPDPPPFRAAPRSSTRGPPTSVTR